MQSKALKNFIIARAKVVDAEANLKFISIEQEKYESIVLAAKKELDTAAKALSADELQELAQNTLDSARKSAARLYRRR